MTVYLSTPSTQLQAEHLCGMPVLLTFVENAKPWIMSYQQTFRRVMIDSSAFSELGGRTKVDIGAYRDWSAQWRERADAVAGLDDISGDYQRSLRNYAEIPWGFPTWHDTDPLEVIPELVAISRERGKWLGIGMQPPRDGKERIIREALDRIPDDIHVHGWALRRYAYLARIDSFDSTNWFRDAIQLRGFTPLNHLTPAECMEIIVKRYQRETRVIEKGSTQTNLW